MSSSREVQRLSDIIDNADAAIGYAAGVSLEGFMVDRRTMDATERCLERLIEAAVKIGADRMAEIAPSLTFHELRGMGNALRHAYDVIDPRIVYSTVVGRLPALLTDCRTALAQAQDYRSAGTVNKRHQAD